MSTLITMPHPSEHRTPERPLGADEAEELTETLKALASPGRLRVLTELLAGERTVEQLAATAATCATPCTTTTSPSCSPRSATTTSMCTRCPPWSSLRSQNGSRYDRV